MPVNYVKHGDFTFDDEKVELIGRSLEVLNKKQAFLGQFASPNAEINGDQIIKRRQILLDPSSVADLNEGDTPREDAIKLVTFSESMRSFGSFIGFTRHAKKRNRDNVLEMARRQLGHNRLYDIEMTRFAAINSTTYSISGVEDSGSYVWWDTFSNARIRLQKNGGAGTIVFICAPEVEAAIAKEAKAANSLIAGTDEGKELFKKGYVGKYAGIEIVSCPEAYMYDDTNSAYRCFFVCVDENGAWPVKENGLSEGNIETIIHDIGDGGHQDPTDEVGTIALRIDYVGAFLEHPELVLKLTATRSKTAYANKVAKDIPEAYQLPADSDTKRGAGRANADFQKVLAGGQKFDLTVAVVAAADGTTIASPTVTIKVGSSSGDAVSPSNSKYALTNGVKYYYSVAKTNYTTKTGTFVADESMPTLTVALVASAG